MAQTLPPLFDPFAPGFTVARTWTAYRKQLR